MQLSSRHIIYAALMAFFAMGAASCHRVDDDRIPPYPCYIPFNTVGEWNVYGVSGAGVYRRFIKSERIPSDYPYSAVSATGFGGVLLIGDAYGGTAAYDLACPVEARADVRITVNDAMQGYCPRCHSTYELITNYGYPLSGPAATDGYALRRYMVVDGLNGTYRAISR